MLTLLHYLHVLFAFAWFGAVFAEHWNTLQARRSKEWARRAILFDLNRGLAAMVALPALLGVGFLGNVFAMQLGFRMLHTPLFMVVDVLWLVLVVVTLAMEMPATGALGALAHAAADAAARGGEGEPAGWGRELGRWRAANGLQLLLYAVLLALMITPWGVVK
ncbi:MAG TPA: hypothetical protein VNM39_12195 [Verrucomicrobiae bacterium]|jgi:hypothetical protein|nr:hypothetical protein [Verrucomicrobiae bacterium]